MNARVRVVLAVTLGFMLVLLAIGAVDRVIVQPAFERLQHAQALEDAYRARAALLSELRQLSHKLGDWARWDDAYAFAADPDPAFIASNLGDWSVLEEGSDLNLCIIVDRDGRVLYGDAYDSALGGPVTLQALDGPAPRARDLLEPVWRDEQSLAGILQTEHGLLLLSAQPIQTTRGTGPGRGALAFGRFLDAGMQATLVEQTQVDFAVLRADDPETGAAERNLLRRLQPDTAHLQPGPDGSGSVYEVLSDLEGRPAALLRTPIRSEIALTAQRTSRALIGALGLMALILLLAGAWLTARRQAPTDQPDVSAGWGSATLAALIGLTFTAGLYREFGRQGLDGADRGWMLAGGVLSTWLLALYLYTLVTRRRRAEGLVAARTTELQGSERKFRSIVDNAPLGIHLYRLQGPAGLVLHDANPAADDILRRAHETLLGRSIEEAFPSLAATDLPDVYRELARAGGVRRWTDVAYAGARGSGVFEVTAFQSEPGAVAVLFADITERHRVAGVLVQRDRLLQATADAMAQLLAGADVAQTVEAALGTLGAAVDAERVYIFENHEDPVTGEHLLSQRNEWCADGATSQIDNPSLQNLSYAAVLPRWHVVLSAGGCIKGRVRDFPAAERELLEPQGIRSILVLPILIHERFWGLIGFDECRSERDWTAVEEQILRLAAAALGHAYVRRRADERQRLAAAVFEAAREAIIVTDAERRIVAVNSAFTSLSGYSEPEVLGRPPSFLRSGRHADAYYAAMWHVVAREGSWQGEFINRRKDGELYVVLATLGEVRDREGRLTHYVGVATDITHQKAAEERIEHLAFYDVLTNLPNRALLAQRADLALALAARRRSTLAVLFLDLDRFKEVNDSLGHSEGDALLVQVATRLRELTRDTDTVSRLGGDEFVVLLPDTDQEGVLQVSDKLLEAFRQPFALAGHNLRATLSMGIALFPHDGNSFSELLKNADAALYRAKQDGRNTRAFYAREMNVATFERLVLESELRKAIEVGQLRAYYQPKVRLRDGRMMGAEALVRWAHPEQGLISPGRFIPVAEASDLIVDLGDWMLAEVCRQAADWRRRGRPPLSIAVNLAARHFRDPKLVTRIQGLLVSHGLPASVLQLELTESTLLEAGPKTVDTLVALEQLGVALVIDDFGTGYSSLSYLKRLPIAALKIDQSFVQDLGDSTDDRILSATIVALSHSLGLDVVAEGVETEEQRRILLEQGCDLAQGYLFGRPLPAAEFARLWDENDAGTVSGHHLTLLRSP